MPDAMAASKAASGLGDEIELEPAVPSGWSRAGDARARRDAHGAVEPARRRRGGRRLGVGGASGAAHARSPPLGRAGIAPATGRSAAPTIFEPAAERPSSTPPANAALRIHLEHSVLDDLDGYRDSEFSVGRGTPGVPDDPLLSRQHASSGSTLRSGAASVLWMGRRAGLLLPAAGGGGEVLRDGAQRPLQHGDCVVLLADAGRLPLIVHIGRGAGWPPPPPTTAQWAEICSLAHEHAEAAARREIVHESEQLQGMVEARAAAAGEVARRARRHSAAPASRRTGLVQHKPFLITAADEPAPVPRGARGVVGTASAARRGGRRGRAAAAAGGRRRRRRGGRGGCGGGGVAAGGRRGGEGGAVRGRVVAEAVDGVGGPERGARPEGEEGGGGRRVEEPPRVPRGTRARRGTATLHAGHAVRGPEQRGQSGEVDVPTRSPSGSAGIEVNKRHIVTAVHPGGAAADEGTLRVGDRLTSVNGERLEAGGRTLRQTPRGALHCGWRAGDAGGRPPNRSCRSRRRDARGGRRPPPPKADAGIALRRPNWDRRHPSSSGVPRADAVGGGRCSTSLARGTAGRSRCATGSATTGASEAGGSLGRRTFRI